MKVITVLSCKLIDYKVHGNNLNVKSKMASVQGLGRNTVASIYNLYYSVIES